MTQDTTYTAIKGAFDAVKGFALTLWANRDWCFRKTPPDLRTTSGITLRTTAEYLPEPVVCTPVATPLPDGYSGPLYDGLTGQPIPPRKARKATTPKRRPSKAAAQLARQEQPAYVQPDYQAMTVPSLRGECKARGLRGYSRLSKPQLVALLKEGGG